MAGEMRQMAETPIGKAIATGDTKKLRECLKAGEDIQFTDRKGNTYFHLLATTYRPYIFYTIMGTKLDINAQNRDGNTALHVTAIQDECGHVTDLMACGADPTIRNMNGRKAEEIPTRSKYWRHLYDKYKPGLREAIRLHDVQRVQYLLNCWCSVEVVIYGKDMRQYAAALTYHDIVALIDQHRFSIMAAYGVMACDYKKLKYALTRPECDVNFLQKVDGAFTHHMLQHAIRQQKCRLVSMLLNAGADVTTDVKLSEYTRGPLFFEALTNDMDHQITEMILQAKPDLTVKDEKGRSALVFVLDRTSDKRTVQLVRRLLDMDIDIALRDDTGCTARDVALFYRRHDVIGAIDKHLISFVKDSDVPRIRILAMAAYQDIFIEYQHRDTWIYAAGNETEDMTNFLRSLQAYWEKMERLHELTTEGNQSLIQQLLEEADDKEMLLLSTDKGGRSLLLKAIMYGHVTLARWLLEQHDGLLQMLDNSYRTPLHYAYGLDGEKRTIIDLLVGEGVPLQPRDVAGRKPQDGPSGWLEVEKKAIYGLPFERDCMEKYERLLRVIRCETTGMTEFNAALKTLKCPVSKMKTVFNTTQHRLVPCYRDLLLAAVDHAKEDIAKTLVTLGADCTITEKYISKSGDEVWYNGEERARKLGQIELANFIRDRQKMSLTA